MPQKTLQFNHPATTIKLGNNGIRLTATIQAIVRYWEGGVAQGTINVPINGFVNVPLPNPVPNQTLYKFEFVNSQNGGIVTITY